MNPPATAPENVKEVNATSFMNEVIETSKTLPVIVYFSAPWCGPCKTFGPALEKAVNAAQGRVKLAKINVDENQQLAAGLRVQSIPAVFVFSGGQPVDGFMGALPDSQVAAFIQRCLKLAPAGEPALNPASMLKQAEAFLAEGKTDHAAALYQDIIDAAPETAAAQIGLIRCLLALGHKEDARRYFEAAPASVKQDKNWEAVEKALALAEKPADAAPASNLKLLLDVTPTDHQTRFDYALALFAEDQKEEAINQLLEIIRRDRKWNNDAAREKLVAIFDALGFADPLAVDGRKKLSAVLFS